jgi:hypothetical protein
VYIPDLTFFNIPAPSNSLIILYMVDNFNPVYFDNSSEDGILKKVKSGIYTRIYINPYIFASGGKVSIETHNMFKDSPYNTCTDSFVVDKNDIIKNKICYAKDGTKCLSQSECDIHNYLLSLSNITFEKEVMYKNFIKNPLLQDLCGQTRCDWYIEHNDKHYIVEYFGLMEKVKYKEEHDKKIEIIKLDGQENNLIKIYDNDLNNLNDIFNSINK